MKYAIQYNYDTGNTFTHDSGLIDKLELTWDNLDVVKQNLKRIEEHYKLYRALDSNFPHIKDVQEYLSQYVDKDWICLEKRLVAYNINKENQTWSIDESDLKHFENRPDLRTKSIYDLNVVQYQIKLYSDEGKVWQIRAPWCGHFESLNSVEIISTENDLKIYF